MSFFETLLGIQSLLFLNSTFTSQPDPPLTQMNTSTTVDLITAEGYPAETHTVTTDDGYILGLHR